MDYRLHTGWTVEQPVPFSHQHHVGGLGIDCRFCHTTVEIAGNAGMPPTYTCMYFNHAIHIAKGVGCVECHGPVDRMPLMHKAHGFTMGFCIDCHADPGPRLRPKDQIFNLEWQRNAQTPSPAALMAEYHIGNRRLTDCSICHR